VDLAPVQEVTVWTKSIDTLAFANPDTQVFCVTVKSTTVPVIRVEMAPLARKWWVASGVSVLSTQPEVSARLALAVAETTIAITTALAL